MTTIMEQQMIIMIQNADLLDIFHQCFRKGRVSITFIVYADTNINLGFTDWACIF